MGTIRDVFGMGKNRVDSFTFSPHTFLIRDR